MKELAHLKDCFLQSKTSSRAPDCAAPSAAPSLLLSLEEQDHTTLERERNLETVGSILIPALGITSPAFLTNGPLVFAHNAPSYGGLTPHLPGGPFPCLPVLAEMFQHKDSHGHDVAY